ncbi:hypothetical protein LSH36_36g04019 [Paralvinella palmiformis]|uniref:Uncharacterized protein n=1 Tax=Paralvinella palmiformis TaxID=53620 RepID=A0AAD9K8N6_9ANNE|nr:hypothetical protein LSH36_36g04019 [Paralvinella palmiformis]
MNIGKGWDKAKELRVCFRCLSESQFGEKCGIDGCKYNHHRLLHEHKHSQKQDSSVSAATPKDDYDNLPKEGESRERTHTTTLLTGGENHMEVIVLRTVAVYLKNESHKLK